MPFNLKSVSFTSPYDAEQQEIERRRVLAQALSQQAGQPLQTNRMVGRVAIPIHPLEGAAQLAKGLSGAYGQKQATEQQKTLGQKAQQDALQWYAEQPAGRLASTPGFDGEPEQSTGGIQQPNAQERMAWLLRGQANPMTAQVAGPLIADEIRRQKMDALVSQLRGAGSGVGTPFEGVPPQIVALMTSGDPELVKLGTTMMEAQKGIAQRPGAPVVNPFTGRVIAQPTPAVPPGIGLQVGPGGPAAYPVPGAIPAMSATTQSQTAAGEAGKAPYQLETLNTEGAPTMMTREQAIQAATGQPMPQPGIPQQGTQQPGAWAAQGPLPISQMPPNQQAAVQALQGGARGSFTFPAQQTQQRAPGLRLQDQGASAEQRKVGEQLGEYYGTAVQDAAKAGLSNRFLQNMRAATEGLRLGRLAPAQSAILQWAQSLGIPVSDADKKAAGNLQALNSMAIKLAGVATRESDSQPAAFQYAQILKAMPDIGRTEQGFIAITNYLQDLNEYKIAKLENLEVWRRDHGGSSGGFEAAWRTKQNELPLFGNKQQGMPQINDLLQELRRRGVQVTMPNG